MMRGLPLIVLSLLYWQPALPDEMDDCMSARGDTAITLCTDLIGSGTDNAAIYHKLVSELRNAGRVDESRSMLDEATARYPRDERLKTLNIGITSADTEQLRLRAAAKRSASGLDRGRAKVSCRLKESEEALAACRRYLELTDLDGDIIRERILFLEERLVQTAERPATVNVEPPDPSLTTAARNTSTTEIADADTDVINVNPSPIASRNVPQSSGPGANTETPLKGKPMEDTQPEVPTILAATSEQSMAIEPIDAEAVRRREAVREVQQLLTRLGLDVGAADGIAGARTYGALSDLNRRTAGASPTDIDALTIEALQTLVNRRDQAQRLVEESSDLASAGDMATARDRLDLARSISPLIEIPGELNRQLLTAESSNPVERSPSVTTSIDNQTAPLRPEMRPPATLTTAPDISRDAMARLSTLQQEIDRMSQRIQARSEAMSSRMARMSVVTASLFAEP